MGEHPSSNLAVTMRHHEEMKATARNEWPFSPTSRYRWAAIQLSTLRRSP